MKIKDRVLAWYVARRIRKEFKRMKPLPKWTGALAGIGAIATAVAQGLKTGDWNGLGPALLTILAMFSHSATGSGGKVDLGGVD